FVGGILGATFGAAFFGVGLFIGTLLGIFLGAFLVELFVRGDLVRSVKSGAGGVLGRLGSIVAKVGVAVAMLIIMGIKIISIF
ncbi:DUF456 family protein, partial [Candidatus Omnitrophota bacterium]